MFGHEPFQPHNIAYLICRRPAEIFSQFGTLVFCCRKSRQNANGVIPNGGAKCRWGRLNAGVRWLKIGDFQREALST